MLDVLEPLEVADCDTSSVAEHVRQEAHSLFKEDILTLAGCRSICSLNDELALELVCVVDVDGLLEGCWDEEIAV